MRDDDELAEAWRTGRAVGAAAPPPSPELRNRLNTILHDHMRAHTRRSQEVSRAEKAAPDPTADKRRRDRS